MSKKPSHFWRTERRLALAHGIAAVLLLAATGSSARPDECTDVPAGGMPAAWLGPATPSGEWSAPSAPEAGRRPGYRLGLVETGRGKLSAELWAPSSAETVGPRIRVIAGLRYSF
jgi:hypothetical protein